MATTATLVSVEDYLRMTEKPNREFRDGVVTAKPMPTKFHSLIQFALAALLRQQGAVAYPELTLRLSPGHYLVPDVAVAQEFPGPYPTEPVLLCCEVLSPDDRLGATLGKCEEYHAWGVPFCWVVDPEKKTAWQYHAASEPMRMSSHLQAGPYSISLADLFAELP